jgi:hypothetical protein
MGPVWVPGDVEIGKATITVGVPAWKDRVTPAKIEVPVVAEKPSAEKVAK